MVDNAWSLRLVSGESMHAMLDDLAQRGRPGIRVMRRVLAKRGLDYIPPASALESRLVQIVEREGLPELRRQVNVGDGLRWIGRVDFKDAELPLIVEVQSERFHTSLIDRQLDAERIARLRAAGFVVVELTDTEVWLKRSVVVDRIRAGRREAALLLLQAA
jgi:very-short-patch-repair endonuclease